MQGKREQFSGFNRTLDAINNVFRKFSAFHDETGRLNVDGMNIISNDGSNKLNRRVHGVLNPTYQAGLRRDAVQPDIEAERKKRDEIEAGKSYCSRRFGGATCDDKSAQIYARFDKNDWRIQPAEFYRFHDAEVNTFGYF